MEKCDCIKYLGLVDPTCGSAGMLISAVAYLKAQKKEWRNVRIYGQEINTLTSAIARMNLFLHGVRDFFIVNGDTLSAPAFIENGQLQRFDLILANPPYSVRQWNRGAFENDKYGRNFLGVPPQGRADYAFIQHILASMDRDTGRCAILLPHGVLNRLEEKNMRKGMIEDDLVECVIGVGKNLFYNSPMEACILIGRSQKADDRKGKVLFLDARKYVTRQGTDSFLTDEQIQTIARAYHSFQSVKGLAYLASKEEIRLNDYSLAINLYVARDGIQRDLSDAKQLAAEWREASHEAHQTIESIIRAMKEEYGE